MDFQYPGEMRLLPVNYVVDLYDVICGRGKKCFNHYGNECFRKVIEARLDEYTNAASKVEKTMIIREIIANIRAKTPEGGFLKYDTIKKRYYEIGETLAREKTSQAFRDALYGGNRTNSALKVKRTIGGTKSKQLLRNPIDSSNTKSSDSIGYMTPDTMPHKVLEYSQAIRKARSDTLNSLRMDSRLEMPHSNTISPSLSSQASILTSLNNEFKNCDDKAKSFTTLHTNKSNSQDYRVRQCDWKGNDGNNDCRYIISDRPKFNMNSINIEKSYNKNQEYNDLASFIEHSNNETSKLSFHRYNDAFTTSLRQDEVNRIHDYYTSKINDILFNRRIQKSIEHQPRRCSIDNLIQAFDIGDIDPFEPAQY